LNKERVGYFARARERRLKERETKREERQKKKIDPVVCGSHIMAKDEGFSYNKQISISTVFKATNDFLVYQLEF